MTRKDVTVQENFWAAPKPYGGYLWFLTGGGQLGRYSPYQDRYSQQHAFDGGVGYSTLLIRELKGDNKFGRGEVVEPYAVTLSAAGILAYGLISRASVKIAPPAGEDEYLSDGVQRFHGMDFFDDALWCLSSRANAISLVKTYVLAQRPQQLWPLDLEAAAGPVAVADKVVAWGRKEFIVFDGIQTRRYRFPQEFSASMSPDDGGPRAGLGQAPAVVSQSDLYIPGVAGNKPAFVNIGVRDGNIPVATLSLSGAASYAQDADSSLLTALEGRFDRFHQTNPQTLWPDRQLRSDRPVFSAGQLQLAFAQNAAGDMLRIRAGGRAFEQNLPPDRLIMDSHGFCLAGPALLCTYTSFDGGAGIISWHA